MTDHVEALRNSIPKINPEKLYSLKEIAKNELIPGNTSYSKIYSLAHVKQDNPQNKMGYEFVPAGETTVKTIKAKAVQKPWVTQISGKLYIKGEELIKFLNLNIERLLASKTRA